MTENNNEKKMNMNLKSYKEEILKETEKKAILCLL